MAGLQVAYANVLLDSMLGDGHDAGWPDPLHAALFLADPAAAGTEVSGGSYARAQVDNDSTNWPNAALGFKALAVDLVWPTATADWGFPRWVGWMTAATSGSLVWSQLLPNPHTIRSGATARIPAGTLRVTYP